MTKPKVKNEDRRQRRVWLILIPLLFLTFGIGVYVWQTTIAAATLTTQGTAQAIQAINTQIAANLTMTGMVDLPPTVATLTPTATSTATASPPTFTATPNQGLSGSSMGAVGNLALLDRATASPTATVYNCFFTWASEQDSETAARLESALQAAQIDYLSVSVIAYGENAVCGEGANQTSTFGVMDRTPLITLRRSASIMNAPARIGTELAAVLQVVVAVTIDRPRLLQIAFRTDEKVFLIWEVDYATAQKAAAARTSGSALFELGTVR